MLGIRKVFRYRISVIVTFVSNCKMSLCM